MYGVERNDCISNWTTCNPCVGKRGRNYWRRAESIRRTLCSARSPGSGPYESLLIALIQTPHRFRTKRQLWAYSGLALRTRANGEYRMTGGQLQRGKRPPALRGLNENHNHQLKEVFKSTATRASASDGPFGKFYAALLATGMRPSMARLTVARKIAAIVLKIGRASCRERV